MKASLRIVRLAIVAMALTAFLGVVTQTHGKPEYTNKEKTGCVTCHTKPGSKDLNDVGKCYEKKHSLEACKASQK